MRGDGAPARDPAPRAGVGAVGAGGARRAAARRSCSSRRRPRPRPRSRWIGDAGLVPPVALLGYVVDQPHRAAFAPLASFSPEWQAVRWANAARRAGRGDRPAAGHTRSPRGADELDGRPDRRRRAARPARRARRGGRRARRRAVVGRRHRAPRRGARRRSTPSPRRWPRCATGTRAVALARSAARRTCAGRSAPRCKAGHEHDRRRVRRVARAGARRRRATRRRPTPPRCAGCRR